MEEQLTNKLLELHNDIEIPPQLLEAARNSITDMSKKKNPYLDSNNPTNIDFINEMAQRSCKNELIRERIIKQEKIELEQYDYENFADDFLKKYSNPEMPNAFSKETLIEQIKQDNNFSSQLLHKKFMDFMLDFTKTTEIDYDEYMTKNYTAQNDKKDNSNPIEDLLEGKILEDNIKEEDLSNPTQKETP
jgi:hypothetical protein